MSFPQYWFRYQGKMIDNYPRAIRLEAKEMPVRICSGEKWVCSYTDQDTRNVVYCENGRPLFCLEYGKDIENANVTYTPGYVKHAMLGLQHAMLVLQSIECVGLHGVTIICKDKVVILSAPSGTGKTTLAKLLRDYHETAVVNGDFAMLSVNDEYGLLFQPTPFCGTSEICHNLKLQVDQIVFLEQAEENCWRNLSCREALVRLLSNVFIPEWDSDIRERVHTNAMRMIERVKCSAFSFAPNRAAADLFFDQVTK